MFVYSIYYIVHVHRTVYGTQYAKHYYAVSLFYLFLLTTNGASVRTLAHTHTQTDLQIHIKTQIRITR